MLLFSKKHHLHVAFLIPVGNFKVKAIQHLSKEIKSMNNLNNIGCLSLYRRRLRTSTNKILHGIKTGLVTISIPNFCSGYELMR